MYYLAHTRTNLFQMHLKLCKPSFPGNEVGTVDANYVFKLVHLSNIILYLRWLAVLII